MKKGSWSCATADHELVYVVSRALVKPIGREVSCLACLFIALFPTAFFVLVFDYLLRSPLNARPSNFFTLTYLTYGHNPRWV